MDIPYAVKQLDRDIALAEARLAEQKADREKLNSALSPQEKAGADEARQKLLAPPKKT